MKKTPSVARAIALLLGTGSLASADPWLFGNTDSRGAQQLVLNGGALVFDTSTSQFDSGTDNQGWWSPTLANIDSNANYIVGSSDNSYHNFFTFDLSSFNGGAISGFLSLPRTARPGSQHTVPPLPFNYLLWDVSTPADVVNDNSGISPAIYADLGSGVSFGSVLVTDLELPDPLIVPLNAAAIAAINAGSGGHFSFGGSLEIPVPEPGTILMLGGGLTGLVARRKLRWSGFTTG